MDQTDKGTTAALTYGLFLRTESLHAATRSATSYNWPVGRVPEASHGSCIPLAMIDSMTRRDVLAAGLSAAAPGFCAKHRNLDKSHLSAITDEIGRTPTEAIAFTKEFGLQWVELRSVPGAQREYTFLPEPELRAAAAEFAANRLRISFLNSSMLKYAWPGSNPARHRGENDERYAERLSHGAQRFERRMEELDQAIRAAQILSFDKVRVFTGAVARSEAPRVCRLGLLSHERCDEGVSRLLPRDQDGRRQHATARAPARAGLSWLAGLERRQPDCVRFETLS